MTRSDGQADRVRVPAAHVGGQTYAPRSAECAPVHEGEVVTGDRAGRAAVPRSLRICRYCRKRVCQTGQSSEPADIGGRTLAEMVREERWQEACS